MPAAIQPSVLQGFPRIRCRLRSIFALGLVLVVAAAARAQEASWPPQQQKESEFTGRKLEAFRHGSRKEWGYAQSQHDTFLVLHPTEARAKEIFTRP